MRKKTCSGNENIPKTVFAGSGAADLGQISDMVARKMHQNGDRQMKCLAFVGAGIENMINSVKDSEMLIIDGCPLDCGKLTMEKIT
ncbi:putative zinc-binding protein [uncultured Sunxiuqinia sp.]|uniref:putative zinc-binding protein n=1 Tax=uncultured Sunxiuqinia sp. TaxID=1573825 RepID=UPI002AA7EC38|nr:putative zinc-binding protein [uncultured Sunxiuqinia sp.]